ncbi:MAG TPA: hypothetical protein VF058_09695 [Actinomycetota bacterium]
MGTHRWLGVGLITLGAGLIVSAILGPLVLGIVDYPLSESLTNQTLGLDAVSLTLVAPVSVLAGALALRGHPAGPVLGFGPAAYGWYMLLQFVVGPEYAYYPGALPLHLGLFVLSGTIAVGSWRAIRSEELPPATRRADRLRGVALLAFSGFLLSRYVPLVADALRGEGLSAEALEGVTMFWSIFLLDLGVVLPATIAAAVGVIAGAPWGRKAMYALVGWWAFVPASVAAMAIVMVGNDDPNASTGQAAVFVVVAVLVLAFAAVVYRGLFRADRVASAPAGEASRRHLTRVG